MRKQKMPSYNSKDFGHDGSHLGEGCCRNLECHLRRSNVPWEGYLQGTSPCVLNDMVPLCDLGFVVNLSDDTNLLCVKTLKRAAGPNGTEPGGMDYLQ